MQTYHRQKCVQTCGLLRHNARALLDGTLRRATSTSQHWESESLRGLVVQFQRRKRTVIFSFIGRSNMVRDKKSSCALSVDDGMLNDDDPASRLPGSPEPRLKFVSETNIKQTADLNPGLYIEIIQIYNKHKHTVLSSMYNRYQVYITISKTSTTLFKIIKLQPIPHRNLRPQVHWLVHETFHAP